MTSTAMMWLLGRVAWLFILRVGAMFILAALIILSGVLLHGCFDHAAFRDVGGTDWTHILRAVWRWQLDVWLMLSLIKCSDDMYKYNATGLFSGRTGASLPAKLPGSTGYLTTRQ